MKLPPIVKLEAESWDAYLSAIMISVPFLKNSPVHSWAQPPP